MSVPDFQKYQISKMLSVRKLSTAHFLPHIRNYETPVHRHTAWEFVFCEHGCVIAQNNTQEYTLRDNQIFFHGSNMNHCIRVGNEETTLFVMSFICTSKCMKLLQGTVMSVTNDQRRRLGMIVEELYNAFELPNGKLLLGEFHPSDEAPLGSEQMVSNYLEGFLLSLLRSNACTKNNFVNALSLEDALENRVAYDLQEYIH